MKNANTVILTKFSNQLLAQDGYAQEVLARVENGIAVKAQMTVPRNIRHLRLFFALVNTVFSAQPEPKLYPTRDHLIDAIKIATGHVHWVKDFKGAEWPIPDSIGFARMDQVKFSEWFDNAVNIILQNILPHCKKEGLENQIYNMLGECGPDALR